jgi:hypothetical protein
MSITRTTASLRLQTMRTTIATRDCNKSNASLHNPCGPHINERENSFKFFCCFSTYFSASISLTIDVNQTSEEKYLSFRLTNSLHLVEKINTSKEKTDLNVANSIILNMCMLYWSCSIWLHFHFSSR